MSIPVKIIKALLANQNKYLSPDELETLIPDEKRKSIHTQALDLVTKGYLDKLEQGGKVMFRIKDGVTEAQLKEAKLLEDAKEPPPPPGNPPPPKEPAGQPLDAQDEFAALVRTTGVKQEIVPTIAKQFFNGDIKKLEWLRQVLIRNAAGFVTPNQARMIITSWAQMCGLPYNPDEFPMEEPGQEKGGKKEPKAEEKNIGAKMDEDTGAGYLIAKDSDGDWVPELGGPLSYGEALAAAQRQNYIKAVGKRRKDEGEETAEDTGGKQGARTVKPAMTFQDKFMEKVLDKMMDDGFGHHDEDSPAVKALQTQLLQATNTIQQMKDNDERRWRENMEANVAAIASRDPFSDPQEVARIRALVGVSNSGVTDNSPVVQLIKEQGARIDKTMDRAIGLFERVALHPEQFNPENTRTPAQKDAAAGALLEQVQQRDKSAAIAKRAFTL